jgi:flagellar hook assembly protein FlgD
MAIPSVTSASNIQMDYMKLLVTQLQNQNPLEPMDNDQMAAQLTQFSQLEQLESMNSNFGAMNDKFGTMDANFANILATSNRDYANSLLGQNVSYMTTDQFTGMVKNGKSSVAEVSSDVNGDPCLLVDHYNLGLEDVSESLEGKRVTYYAKVGDTTGVTSGVINGVETDLLGNESLIIDGHSIEAKDVITDSLTNQSVSYLAPDSSELKKLVISDIGNDADGKLRFKVGRFISLENVLSVHN